jgi:hypothetical protein
MKQWSLIKKCSLSITLLGICHGVYSNDVSIKVLSSTIKNKTIADAKVTLQRNGASSVTGKTSSEGVCVFSPSPFGGVDDSTVQMIIEKPGYSTLVVKGPCNGLTYALSESMVQADGTRVVLSWGEKPEDMDSHLCFPGNHIYYDSQIGDDANLDVDDTDSYGPETITITRKKPGQEYIYAVHNYTDRENSESRDWRINQAKVFVYVGNKHIRTYYVTPKSVGNLWVVFGIDGSGNFYDINEFTSVSSSDEVDKLVSSRQWSVHTKTKVYTQLTPPSTSKLYTFKSNELAYELPAVMKPAMAYYSDYFYAIMLKSQKSKPFNPETPCEGFYTEEERLKIQEQFPNNKVFASRSGCDAEVSYSNTNREYEFLAVYGGATMEEAKKFLKTVKATNLFDGPNIRQMQVIVKLK